MPVLLHVVDGYGETALVLTAAVVILWLGFLGMLAFGRLPGATRQPSKVRGRQDAIRWLDRKLAQPQESGRLAVIAASVELSEAFMTEAERQVPAHVLRQITERLISDLREEDCLARGDVSDLLLCFSRLRAPQADTLERLVRRLQLRAQEPIDLGGRRFHPRLTIGAASSRLTPTRNARDFVALAEDAHDTAAERGPGDVVLAGMKPASASDDTALVTEVADALENGQITAWYQPQLSTETGDISGFEALARWEHPMRGIVSPASFLPLVERAGLSRRLAKVVLTHALSAIRTWDRAGLGIPGVGVNFSAEELRDPNLADFLAWELDRFDLTPARLVLEVLETVISESHEDAVARNLRALSKMGCRIDLDDFGTGFTSIINIRRFDVSRIKIDRKLVSGAATDPSQRDLIAALLSMSEHLRVETLGEGVETKEEQLALAQLGCGHVQGFGIARPMPLGDTLAWTLDHRARIAAAKSLHLEPRAPG